MHSHTTWPPPGGTTGATVLGLPTGAPVLGRWGR